MNKEIEKLINIICSDWAPQDNNKMKRVLDENKKSILLEQIIEPLLTQQKEEFNKAIEDILEKYRLTQEERLKKLLKSTKKEKDFRSEFDKELEKPEYEFQGNGRNDSIKCWGCGKRISVEDIWEASDGHFYCCDCGSEIDEVSN